jgi:hypothetical protein
MPKKRCSVCNHSQVEAIDAALKSGESVRKTAARFGLSPTAISRHENHGKHAEARINTGQIAHIDEEIKKLTRAQNRAKKKRDTNQVLAIARELRNWFVLKQKAELALITTHGETPNGAEISPRDALALAKSVIESQLDDPEVQSWLTGLMERVAGAPASADEDEFSRRRSNLRTRPSGNGPDSQSEV